MECLFLFFRQASLLLLADIFCALLDPLLTQLLIVFLPFGEELLIVLDLRLIVMMFELLPDVDVTNAPHMWGEFLAMELEDVVVES